MGHFYNEYIEGLDAFIDFAKTNMLDNVRRNLCYPCKHCKNEKKYHTYDMLMSHLIKHGFMEDYQCWNKHGDEGLNEGEMRDSYMEREVPTGVEEEHGDDINEAAILGLIDDDIKLRRIVYPPCRPGYTRCPSCSPSAAHKHGGA
jgi:hypothetical protein